MPKTNFVRRQTAENSEKLALDNSNRHAHAILAKDS